MTRLPDSGLVFRINGWLDRLPRATIHVTGAESPAFRGIGIIGFHLALLTVIGGALVRGLPVDVAVIVAVISALSFFAWALLRRAVTGREALVLFEHVWFAGATVVLVLWLLHAPLLTWLDVLSVALAVFLAVGRVGCAVAGCCHGHPASLGIRYPDDHPVSRVAGLRVFPVPLIESAGLLGIAIAGALALPWAAPGAVLVWALAAYAVLRFGLESLRGDHRPHVLGVPVARFAAGLQLAAAMVIDTVRTPGPHAWLPAGAAGAGLAATGLAGLFWYRRRPRPVTADQVAQARAALARARSADGSAATQIPAVATLPGGITVAASRTGDGMHLSVAGADVDPATRTRFAAAAIGDDGVVFAARSGVVHAVKSNGGQVPVPAQPSDVQAFRFTLPPWMTIIEQPPFSRQ